MMPLSLPSPDHPNPAIKLFPLTVIRRAGISFSVLDALAWDGAAAETDLEKRAQSAAACRKNLLQALDQELRRLPAGSLRLAIYNVRKAVYQGKTPRIPLNLLPQTLQDAADQWRAALDSLRAQKNAVESAYHASLSSAFHQLQTLAEDPDIQAALLYASHDLLTQLPVLQKKTPEAWRKKEKQTALALARYVARAASKTTPFSRFGMVGLQQAHASETDFPDHKRAVSPNVGLLPAIYALLLQQPVFFRSLRVQLNACITRNSSPYTWLYYNGAEEGFQQSAGTPTLDALTGQLLESGRSAAFGTVSDYLQSITDADPAALETWLRDLTDTGLLEWALPENGLSASWAGNLYQYLGSLPAEPIIVDTALLLQWLRTTARTLPYLDARAGLQALQDAWSQVQAYFERHNGHCPDIPLERLFYEEVAYSQPILVPEADLLDWACRLETLRQSTAPHTLPPLHRAFQAYLQQMDAPTPWLAAVRGFMDAGLPEPHAPVRAPAGRGKTGALLQPFLENGRWKAVVNALYPGGGKMLARWMHLFPASAQQTLREWNAATEGLAAFPFQDWHNANFQPAVCPEGLATPGDRINRLGAALLGNLLVAVQENSLRLTDGATGRPVQLTDLGLEAPESRPPAMQLLWHSGVPYRAARTLLQPEQLSTVRTARGWRYRPRVETAQFILARAVWFLDPADYAAWQDLSGFDFFQTVRAALKENEIPRRFFARFEQEKPQYFDFDSPLLMLIFEKAIRKARGALALTEMAPVPEANRHAFEIAFEWEADDV
jgi:hypothetical protein